MAFQSQRQQRRVMATLRARRLADPVVLSPGLAARLTARKAILQRFSEQGTPTLKDVEDELRLSGLNPRQARYEAQELHPIFQKRVVQHQLRSLLRQRSQREDWWGA